MIALVTGTTGFIGQHLVAQLLLQGFSVCILTRGTYPLPETLAQQVEIVYGDLIDKISILKSVSGWDIVFHLAGELNNQSCMSL
jgi:nucleoside-diphosphate-sugar epimerase